MAFGIKLLALSSAKRSILFFKFETRCDEFGEFVGHFLFIRPIDRDGHTISTGQPKGKHGKDGGRIGDIAVRPFDLHFAFVTLNGFGDDARWSAMNAVFVLYC